MNLSFIKHATYSHFLRGLSSTFVVNENCFSEKWPLNVTVSVETAYGCHSSESVASCGVVGGTPGDTRDGLDRADKFEQNSGVAGNCLEDLAPRSNDQ